MAMGYKMIKKNIQLWDCKKRKRFMIYQIWLNIYYDNISIYLRCVFCIQYVEGGRIRCRTNCLLNYKKTKMAAMSGSSKNDALYISLLGLAENFRVSNPPNIRLCIHCLQSIFNINPPPLIVSRTHLQLGNILLAHTKNKELATRHLEQAVS